MSYAHDFNLTRITGTLFALTKSHKFLLDLEINSYSIETIQGFFKHIYFNPAAMQKIFTIAQVTFKEMIRQPVYSIIVYLAMILIYGSPWFSMFTLLNSLKLVRDMGLATIMLASLFIAAFSASGLVYKEIENKTAITIMSKPIFRMQFVIGKYLGLLAGMVIAVTQLTLILILTIRLGVPETAQFVIDKPVVYSLNFLLIFCIFWSALINYFFERPFTSTLITTFFILLVIVFCFVAFVNPSFQPQQFGTGMELGLLKAGILIFLAMAIITSIALIGSIRFNMLANLIFCFAVFFITMTSDYFFGRFADTNIICKAIYAIIPNLQFFWVADAFLQNNTIPSAYVTITLAYSGLCIVTAVVMSWVLFSERELA
ncbi:MAG: hypothetical protein RBU23_04720 [Candidatus Auribacterota bacterium]|jgi:hypothetical protein|nr:hypothetical protein [Candidatus Auribacterota bacterium]